MRGLSISQVIYSFIGASLWWYFQEVAEVAEVAGFWVAAFNVIVIVALMYAIGKAWRPLETRTETPILPKPSFS